MSAFANFCPKADCPESTPKQTFGAPASNDHFGIGSGHFALLTFVIFGLAHREPNAWKWSGFMLLGLFRGQ